MSLKGSFSKLSTLREGLARVQGYGVDAVAESAANELARVVDKQFEQGRGPDGKRWARLANGEASHLEETKEMRETVTVVPTVKAIDGRITGKRGQARFHQNGTSKMPARPLVPEPNEPLPDRWSKPLAKVAAKTITALIRTKR